MRKLVVVSFLFLDCRLSLKVHLTPPTTRRRVDALQVQWDHVWLIFTLKTALSPFTAQYLQLNDL